MSLTAELAERDFEQVVLCRDPEAGLTSVIAVHDTTLGPSLGGIRMRAYPDQEAAVADALNLAEAMTYKAALAGLALGGGKSVINLDPHAADRDRVLAAHARYIAALGGRYIPAVDMGTTVADLDLVGRYVPTVSSQRRDPSYFTARGVVAAIRAAVDRTDLAGLRVAVQGLGHVGAHVATMLADDGAELVVSDVDEQRVAAVGDRAVAVSPEEILGADVDVLCPCAAGGVIDERAITGMKARHLVGAANNVLADRSVAVALAETGIVHVPDFVANAGGLIACEAELRGDDSTLDADVDRIAETSGEILRQARRSGKDTVTVAIDTARALLATHRERRPYFTP